MKKNILPLIISLIAIIVFTIGFFCPWYNFHLEMKSNLIQNDMNYNIDYYLSKVVFEGEIFGNPISQSYNYNDIRQLISKIPGYNIQSSSINKALGIFDTTLYMVVLSIIFSSFTLIFAIGPLLNINKYNLLKKLNLVFACLTFSLAISAVFYFIFVWNSLIQRGISIILSITRAIPIPLQLSDISFWYSFSQGGNKISMGPGYSWYLFILGAVFSFIAVFLVYKNFKPLKSKELSSPYFSENLPINENE